MKLSLLFGMTLLMATSFAHAADKTGALDLSLGYVSAPDMRAGLESDLSKANGNQTISCTNVVSVHTGGTMGSATAGLCSVGGKPAAWACRNDMVGNTSVQVDADPMTSDGFNLAVQIIQNCVGG